MKIFVVVSLALLLLACGVPEDQYQIPAQKWEDIVIKVESQPAPVVVGMNEFLILATLERGKPVHELVIALRGGDSEPWQQAIQDGFSGVYRKAVIVPPGVDELQVQVRRKRTENEVVLYFPMFSAKTAVQKQFFLVCFSLACPLPPCFCNKLLFFETPTELAALFPAPQQHDHGATTLLGAVGAGEMTQVELLGHAPSIQKRGPYLPHTHFYAANIPFVEFDA